MAIIEQDGYTFETSMSNNEHRPYRARCIENNDIKDSALSHQDAINLLLNGLNFRLP